MLNLLDNQEQSKNRPPTEVINWRASHRYQAQNGLRGVFEQQFGDKVKAAPASLNEQAPVDVNNGLVPVADLTPADTPDRLIPIGDLATQVGLNDVDAARKLADQALSEQEQQFDPVRIFDVPETL
jgi:hypothetical protein